MTNKPRRSFALLATTTFHGLIAMTTGVFYIIERWFTAPRIRQTRSARSCMPKREQIQLAERA